MPCALCLGLSYVQPHGQGSTKSKQLRARTESERGEQATRLALTLALALAHMRGLRLKRLYAANARKRSLYEERGGSTLEAEEQRGERQAESDSRKGAAHLVRSGPIYVLRVALTKSLVEWRQLMDATSSGRSG